MTLPKSLIIPLALAIVTAFGPAAAAETPAQAAATPAKTAKEASPCKGLAEAACVPPQCRWIGPTKTKAGKERRGYCRKAPVKKASATGAAKPNP